VHPSPWFLINFFSLLDIIGVIVDVNPIEERKVHGGKVDMLSIRLKDIRYRIYIILTQPLCVVACVH
jgi:hypothetical protein